MQNFLETFMRVLKRKRIAAFTQNSLSLGSNAVVPLACGVEAAPEWIAQDFDGPPGRALAGTLGRFHRENFSEIENLHQDVTCNRSI